MIPARAEPVNLDQRRARRAPTQRGRTARAGPIAARPHHRRMRHEDVRPHADDESARENA